MRTYLQSKDMAKALRESLAAQGVELSHSQCLELVAKQFGFADWNILASKIAIETTPGGSGNAEVELEPPIPTLRVTSLEAAAEFYVQFLGFKFDWGHESRGEPVYAQVSRGEVQLHLAQQSEGGRPTNLLFREQPARNSALNL